MYIYYKKINFNRKKKKLNLYIYYRKKKLIYIYIYIIYMECYKYISNYLANHSLCSLIEIKIRDILYFI